MLRAAVRAGNTRWNLKGHTAPPDAIRFDNRGHKFLTFDSEGRDRWGRSSGLVRHQLGLYPVVWDCTRGSGTVLAGLG